MTLPQSTIEVQLNQALEELQSCHAKIARLRQQLPQPVVHNYTLTGPGNAPVSLASLFGEHKDMIVIHNMGASCAYCTLWADGFNGLLPYLQDRAAFVVISPDAPEMQQNFAQKRGWRFAMVSSQNTTFRADMGFQSANELMPGVSVFHKHADDTIIHTTHDIFGPGDDYCSLWHLFDLLPNGSKGWEPAYNL